ncbi:hypothetical protein AL543_18395 [Vibrio mimicus]|nr:hypothetical protein AL543_18395 [Vibrio mimicus]
MLIHCLFLNWEFLVRFPVFLMVVFQLSVWSPPPLDSWLRLQKNILYVKYHKKTKAKKHKIFKIIHLHVFHLFFRLTS